MIKLNRTTEYGIIALRHICRKNGISPTEVTSAREIADTYGLPFEITAKTLQRLKDKGLIESAQGARGGYTIQKPLERINLAEFLELMEGAQSIVPCAASKPDDEDQAKPSCEYSSRCEMQSVMGQLNSKLQLFLTGILLTELVSPDVTPKTLDL